jgi:hypothetical protein
MVQSLYPVSVVLGVWSCFELLSLWRPDHVRHVSGANTATVNQSYTTVHFDSVAALLKFLVGQRMSARRKKIRRAIL